MAVDGDCRDAVGQAVSGEHGVTTDLPSLLPALHDAAHNHVVDGSTVNACACDNGIECCCRQIDWVPTGQFAAALASRGSNRVYNIRLSHHVVLSVHVNCVLVLSLGLNEASDDLESFMEVRDAVAARRSVRGFLDRPVDLGLVGRLVAEASRAASGGNLQPWHIDVVASQAMTRLKHTMRAKLEGAPEPMEYDIYPKELNSPYRERRFAVGEAMYERVGIPRDDKAARRTWFDRNFAFFGAPLALFMTIDRRMGSPQWSDMGMFLQSFMLLAVEEGLATCPQECWAIFPQTVKQFLETPEERMLFCGLAVGYEDTGEPANALRTERADVSEWMRILVD